MIESLMLGVFRKAAIDRAALIANRDGGQQIIKRKIDGSGDEKAEKFCMIAKDHTNREDDNTQSRVEILLQIKTLIAAYRALLDLLRLPAVLGEIQRDRLCTLLANQLLDI